MKDTLKRKLFLALCILGAFVAGAAAMNLFYMRIRPTYRDVMRVTFRVDQEFRASRATRNVDLNEALVHRWNVVDSHPQGTINIFDDGIYKGEDSDFWFPFKVYILGMIGKSSYERGELISKGIDCGKLAFLLESMGASKEADSYWDIAQRCINKKTVKDTKSLIIRLYGLENTDIHKDAEAVILKE